MSLHIVTRFLDKELAIQTAPQMDCKWQNATEQFV